MAKKQTIEIVRMSLMVPRCVAGYLLDETSKRYKAGKGRANDFGRTVSAIVAERSPEIQKELKDAEFLHS